MADFATTQWSIVLSAAQGNERSSARQALAELCRRYWFPLYAFIRRSGQGAESSMDLTQEFFARILEKNLIAAADPERGRFRNFLLASLKNFLANEHDRQQAAKRGGGQTIQSLDLARGESLLQLEPMDSDTPERRFERDWVTSLLELVLQRLQAEYASSGRSQQYELFQASLYGPREGISYAEAAQQLQMSEDAARQAAMRLRKRYREILREEVAATMSNPLEVDEEIRGMFKIMAE